MFGIYTLILIKAQAALHKLISLLGHCRLYIGDNYVKKNLVPYNNSNFVYVVGEKLWVFMME